MDVISAWKRPFDHSAVMSFLTERGWGRRRRRSGFTVCAYLWTGSQGSAYSDKSDWTQQQHESQSTKQKHVARFCKIWSGILNFSLPNCQTQTSLTCGLLLSLASPPDQFFFLSFKLQNQYKHLVYCCRKWNSADWPWLYSRIPQTLGEKLR